MSCTTGCFRVCTLVSCWLQYTISGKKVEVAVRRTIMGEDVPQRGALANPDCLLQYANIPELQGY